MPGSLRRLVLLAALIALAGCASPAPSAPTESGVSDARIRVLPDTASPGLARTVSIIGDGADFVAGGTAVDFGDGVAVQVLQVVSSFTLRAQIVVADDAELGPRDVTVTWGEQRRILRGGFVVEAGAITASPERAALGDTLVVDITGWNTEFGPQTSVSFGDTVDVIGVEVVSLSRLRATVSISPRSDPGWVDLVVFNPGGDFYTLRSAFLVDRELRRMEITPDEAAQRDELVVRVYVEDGNLMAEATELDLGTGVVISDLAVLGPEWLQASLRIGNNAVTGPRDVVVRVDDGQERIRLLPDGFTIFETPGDPTRVRATLSFGISRVWRPDSCTWRTSTYATARFYEPHDFPCPSTGASSTLAPPPQFDVAGTGFSSSSGASTDCPQQRTFDAGPWVRFVSPDAVVELDREWEPYSGRVSYRAIGLTPEDYVTDTLFDLQTAGGDLGGGTLPAFYIPEVLYTLRTDYSQTGPELCQAPWSLQDPLPVRWTPAQTYDVANMYLFLTGAAQDEGTPIMLLYPWDDGEFSYSPEQLGFFTPGPASLLQYAWRTQRFDIPGSELTNAGYGSSGVQWRGSNLFVE